MTRILASVPVLAVLLVLTGCTTGILFQHTKVPLTHDYHANPSGAAGAESDIKHIQVPYVGIMWGDASLADIARQKGLQELYYADAELLSILTIWRQYTVHLYGR
jgi:hypothetical protein